MALLRSLLPSRFTLALIVTVGLASLLPCRGTAAQVFDAVTDLGIALLFFLHGAKLSRAADQAAAGPLAFAPVGAGFHVRAVSAARAGAAAAATALLSAELYLGVLFVCPLPSTVQSSIAFTSIARGNVPAAVVSASVSNLLGIFITPLWSGVLLATQGRWRRVAGSGMLDDRAAVAVAVRRRAICCDAWIGGLVDRHRRLVHATDQGTILLVVYTAFSAAVVEGLWRQTPADALLGVAGGVRAAAGRWSCR